MSVPGTKQYMAGKPALWGGSDAVAYGPGGPPSNKEIRAGLKNAQDETRYFSSREEVRPAVKEASWKPSWESWGPDGPPFDWEKWGPDGPR